MLRTQHRCLTRIGVLHPVKYPALCSRSYIVGSRGAFLTLTRTVAKPRARQPLEPAWHHYVQRRGAKRKTTLNFDELPQGPIEGAALPPQDDTEPEYPPLLQQVRNNMLKFSHCVVVTRVGGFYEVSIHLAPFKTTANMISCTLNMPTSWLLF
jgi:hypothetical protein